MNGKERVYAAIARNAPDRTPCGFHATPAVLERLYAHFATEDYAALLAALGADIVDIRGVVDPHWQGPFPKKSDLGGGVTQNYLGWQMKTVETEFGPETTHCGYVLGEAKTVEAIRAFPWPRTGWFDFSDFAERLQPYRDFAVMASGASVFQHATLVRGMDRLFIDMMANPELAEAVLNAYTDFYVDYYAKMFEAAAGAIDILRIADDLGTQQGPLMGLDVFEQFVTPRVRRLAELAHAHDVLLMFHSCGSIRPFIPALLEAGIDILDPIQPRAAGMTPVGIKRDFGSQVCLHGAIDTQYTLPRGTPDEVGREVRERLDTLAVDGGYIVAPSHTLQPDVPTENILRLYQTVTHT